MEHASGEAFIHEHWLVGTESLLEEAKRCIEAGNVNCLAVRVGQPHSYGTTFSWCCLESNLPSSEKHT